VKPLPDGFAFSLPAPLNLFSRLLWWRLGDGRASHL
jgi:hypothetical protein